MMTQLKFTSTILTLQTLIDVRKAPHRRARSELPNSLDDMYCVIIQGMFQINFQSSNYLALSRDLAA